MRVAMVPAERPAMVSTRAGERPASFVSVMGDGSIAIAATLCAHSLAPEVVDGGVGGEGGGFDVR